MVGPYADAPSGPTPPQLPAAASEISLVSHTFGMLTRTDPSAQPAAMNFLMWPPLSTVPHY